MKTSKSGDSASMLGHDLTLWEEADSSSNAQNLHHFLYLPLNAVLCSPYHATLPAQSLKSDDSGLGKPVQTNSGQRIAEVQDSTVQGAG
jgi:hypothetical protein